jgi:hypothetical protein
MLISKVKRISKIQSSFLQRHLCTKAKADKEKKNVYSHTVNLPSTQFPLWVKPQDRAKLDEKIHRVRLKIGVESKEHRAFCSQFFGV